MCYNKMRVRTRTCNLRLRLDRKMINYYTIAKLIGLLHNYILTETYVSNGCMCTLRTIKSDKRRY